MLQHTLSMYPLPVAIVIIVSVCSHCVVWLVSCPPLTQPSPFLLDVYDMLRDKKTTQVLTLLSYRGEDMMRLRDWGGSTLFMRASGYGNMEVVVEMEKVVGCTPLAVNVLGNTALHRAALFGHSEMVRYLSNNYPSMLNMRNKWGNTPFVEATRYYHTETERVFREM